MYEVTTTTKTLLTTNDPDLAMQVAKQASETHSYVEVKKVITVAPWRAESVKIFC